MADLNDVRNSLNQAHITYQNEQRLLQQLLSQRYLRDDAQLYKDSAFQAIKSIGEVHLKELILKKDVQFFIIIEITINLINGSVEKQIKWDELVMQLKYPDIFLSSLERIEPSAISDKIFEKIERVAKFDIEEIKRESYCLAQLWCLLKGIYDYNQTELGKQARRVSKVQEDLKDIRTQLLQRIDKAEINK